MKTESENRADAAEQTWNYYESRRMDPPDSDAEEWQDRFYQNLYDLENEDF